jgi:hypothetical protein
LVSSGVAEAFAIAISVGRSDTDQSRSTVILSEHVSLADLSFSLRACLITEIDQLLIIGSYGEVTLLSHLTPLIREEVARRDRSAETTCLTKLISEVNTGSPLTALLISALCRITRRHTDAEVTDEPLRARQSSIKFIETHLPSASSARLSTLGATPSQVTIR